MFHPPEGLKGFIIYLVVAGIIVPLFHRARIGAVLGFLIAGAVLGPFGLGRMAADHPWITYVTFDQPARAAVLAELGIVMLLFLLGLELSLQRLWQLRRYVLGVGLAQVALTTIAIGLAVRFLVAPPPAGIVLGLCLALSSTAIVMQLLIERHHAATHTGRIALSILLFQDLMVVPVLVVVGVLAGGGEGGILALVRPFLLAMAIVVVIMLAGRYLVGPLLHSALRTGSRSLIMAISLLILVVIATTTAIAGLSVALGAFLAGLLLSDSEARHQIEVDLEPFKDLLLGIFFITVGTQVNLGAVAGDIGWILLAVVVLMSAKAAILFGVTRLFGVPRAASVQVALLLSQAGEFGFIVLGIAQTGNLLPPRIATGTIAVIGITMLLTPLVAMAAFAAGRRLEESDNGRHMSGGPELAGLEGHVVIGGFGRVGQTVARVLEAENVPYVALDNQGARVTEMRRAGRPVYFGDAGRLELLEKMGAAGARAFVATVNNPKAAERMVAAVRQIRPKAPIFARAADPSHAALLVKLGAVDVIPDAVEASLQLAGRLLEGLDLPQEAVQARLAKMREAELGRLTKKRE